MIQNVLMALWIISVAISLFFSARLISHYDRKTVYRAQCALTHAYLWIALLDIVIGQTVLGLLWLCFFFIYYNELLGYKRNKK